MRRSVIGFAAALASAPLGAQQPPDQSARAGQRAGGECQMALVGGGPRCAPERRLVIDVRARGAALPDRGQLLAAVGVGAAASGAFFLPLDRAAAADSALYAVLEVDRGADGAFRIEAHLAGPRAPRAPALDLCRSSATGSYGDVGFGAHLAFEVMQLARCAQAQRRTRGS